MKNALTHKPVIEYKSRTQTEKLEDPVFVKSSSGLEDTEPLALLLLAAVIFVVYRIFKKPPGSTNITDKGNTPKDLNGSHEKQKLSQPSGLKEESNSFSSAQTLTQMVAETLKMQVASAAGSKEVPKDDFIIGYIGGYCDAALQIGGIDNNSAEGVALLTAGFQAVYKNEKFMNDFFAKQTTSVDMRLGIDMGFEDVMNWLKPTKPQNKKSPENLMAHILIEYFLPEDEEEEEEVELASDKETKIIEAMIDFANTYCGKNADQIIKQLRKDKRHFLDDGGNTISVNPKDGEAFQVIFGTDRSEEKPSMTIFCTDEFVGITIFVMGKDTGSWAGSLEPTPASGLGPAAERLFNKLINDNGLRDINSIYLP